MKQRPIASKIDNRLNDLMVAESIVNSALDTRGQFNGQPELKKYLSEGAMLNVSKIAADALSIPNGKYMIWTSDTDRTMLVPIRTKTKDVFEHRNEKYDVYTPDLINHWTNVSKVIGEDEEEDSQFKSNVDPGDIDRTPLLRAMEQQGHTVTSLANAIGVDPPAISRLLRVPHKTSGDPGGRNPSINTASLIATELRASVESLFPDIFKDMQPKKARKNRGSGGGKNRSGEFDG